MTPLLRQAALLLLAAAPLAAQGLYDAPPPPKAAPSPMRLAHRGLFGDYHMTRDASGTSWQPEATPMEGRHGARGEWRYMAHGRLTAGVTAASGPRGETGGFTTSMLMGQARRDAGPRTLAFRAMASLEPLMGMHGYPELLQSGETADGRTLLIDRQHPHDALMELAAAYTIRQDGDHPALFFYGGLPGEPALGPPAFMHRASAQENPEAPIGHHWQDSTHISYGVVTAGLAGDVVKVEFSGFNGREPDRYRWDIDKPGLDSFAGRISINPSPAWAFQASAGKLHSPDALAPGVDTVRVTVSAMNYARLDDSAVATTAVFGLNRDQPGSDKASLLLESSWYRGKQTFFGRFEWVQKDELLLALGANDPLVRQFYPNGIGVSHLPTPSPGGPAPTASVLHAPIYGVSKLGGGVTHDVGDLGPVAVAVGAAADLHFIAAPLRGVYGSLPLSGLVWVRFAAGGGR